MRGLGLKGFKGWGWKAQVVRVQLWIFVGGGGGVIMWLGIMEKGRGSYCNGLYRV